MSRPIVREVRTAGIDGLQLENAALRVTVLPALGGHIAELVDRSTGRDLLWHNPRTAPRPAPYGAHFDDWWSGGWDEIFPSGDRGTLRGEALPYMGELWCVPWSASSALGDDDASITAVGFGTVAPVRFERRLTLRADEPVLRVRYRVESLDVRPFPYTWGIHPAFAVSPSHRIDHPGREMLVGVSSDASMGAEGQRYTWPELPDPSAASGVRDMRRARPREDAVFAGHWALGLAEGWLALTDIASGHGASIVFDREVFPQAWLWQVYGGWRGHHHVALEPWSSQPMELDAAEAAGVARTLRPGEALETEVAVVLFSGLDRVSEVRRLGDGFVVA